MKNYIFVTTEGYTYQPNSESVDPDIENLQVIGFANGNNPKQAFQKLLKESNYLLETSFDEVVSYELTKNSENTKAYHYLTASK